MPEVVLSRLRSVRDAAGVFLLCLAVYFVNGRPQPEVDCVVAPYVAWSLVRHGSLDLTSCDDLTQHHPSELHATPDGRLVSFRPIGSALAAVPFVAPCAAASAP